MTLLSILIAILLINFVVVLHELGHYIPSRWYGRPVKAFSVGFGKEIVGRTDSLGTRWKISMIPLGGYVMFDDEGEEVGSLGLGMLGKVSWLGFALITLGGVIVNFMTAWLYLWVYTGKVWRIFDILALYVNTPSAFVNTFTQPGTDETFVGPIGILSAFSDPKTLVALFPVVSLGLAVTNLIPIPIFDGGQFLFGSIEHARKKAFSKRAQIWLSAVSMGILAALLVASTISDIVRIAN